MSDSQHSELPPSSEPHAPGTRIDPAHPLAKGAEREANREAVPQLAQAPVTAFESTETVSPTEELRAQAAQLADYLRSRQRDLDHREAKMNANLAQLDGGLRDARLWANEQQDELKRREREIEDRLTRLIEVEAATDQNLRAREEEMALRESLLDQADNREHEPSEPSSDEKADSPDDLTALERKEKELAQREEIISIREKELRAAFEERRQTAVEQLARRKEALQSAPVSSFLKDEFPVSVSDSTEIDDEESLQHRERKLNALAEELKLRANNLDAAEKALREAEREIDEAKKRHEQQIDTEKQRLEQTNHQMLADLERLRAEAQVPSPELLTREKALEERTQSLDETEKLLDENRVEIDRLHREWVEQREADQQAARAERKRIAIEHRQAIEDLEEKRQSLQQRSEHVDQCHASLNQLRTELGHMHRETLEIRLATEEMWVELSGSAPPASLTQSLGRIRSKLAEHYRSANVQLSEQREELSNVRSELAKQHESLVSKKREWEHWIEQRREEIETQAERLVAREQELQHQEDEFKELSRRWQAEQFDYRQEIHRLRSQRHKTGTTASTV